jgi:hypothetical protein
MLWVTIGTTVMAAGFAARIPMTNDPGSITTYIPQTLVCPFTLRVPADMPQLLLLSPCAFLAQDYALLPRLAVWLDAEDCLFLRASKIFKIFIWSDAVTFFLQMSGGGMGAASSSIAKVGTWISIVGLAFQCASFGLFTILLFVFGRRM